MKTSFTTFKNSSFPLVSTIPFKRISKVVGIILTSGMIFMGSFKANAQTTLIVPNSNEGSAFIGPFGNAARKLQFLIDDTLLTSLVGKKLKSISFRLPSSTAESWPTTALTMESFNIYLSKSVEPSERQLDFAANVVGTQTQVRSGALELPAGALTVGSNPNDFSLKINFNEQWLYEGGNLLLEIRHSGTGISSRTVQAVGTSSQGYGTLFSALWQSTGSVTQGNFCYVEFTADDDLGASSVRILDQTLVYPNPAKDMLNVRSDKEFSSYSIYSINGQLLTSGKLTAKTPINLSKISAGNYILKLTDKDGNTQASPFIKN